MGSEAAIYIRLTFGDASIKKAFKLLVGLIAIAGFCDVDNAQAAIIAQYTFPGPDTALETGPQYDSTTTASGVTASPITEPGNLILEISSAATTPANAPFLRSVDSNATSAADAVTGNEYFEFTVSPGVGSELDLASLTFNVARGGGSTPRGYVVRSSADGYSTDLSTADVATVRPAYTAVNVSLADAAFQNLITPLGFRFYIYAPGAGSSVDFDDITLNGEVTAVPEPSAIALLGLGIVGMVAVARRRSR